MSALTDLSKLASNANSNLISRIEDFESARAALIRAHEDQGLLVRALATVAHDHDVVRRGQELELRAIQALAESQDRRQP